MIYKIIGIAIIIVSTFIFLALLSTLPEIIKLIASVINTNSGVYWGELSAYVVITGIIGLVNYYFLKFGIKLSRV